MSSDLLALIYVVTIFYCLYKLQRRYEKTSLGGGIGVTPGLDVLMVVILAPLLTMVDVSLTWIRLYKEAEEIRIKKDKQVL